MPSFRSIAAVAVTLSIASITPGAASSASLQIGLRIIEPCTPHVLAVEPGGGTLAAPCMQEQTYRLSVADPDHMQDNLRPGGLIAPASSAQQTTTSPYRVITYTF